MTLCYSKYQARSTGMPGGVARLGCPIAALFGVQAVWVAQEVAFDSANMNKYSSRR